MTNAAFPGTLPYRHPEKVAGQTDPVDVVLQDNSDPAYDNGNFKMWYTYPNAGKWNPTSSRCGY